MPPNRWSIAIVKLSRQRLQVSVGDNKFSLGLQTAKQIAIAIHLDNFAHITYHNYQAIKIIVMHVIRS